MAAKAEGAGDESRDDSVASRGLSSSEDESTGASGTGTGSESGSGSSSDEEEEEEEEEEGGKEGGKEGAWRPQHGGKTVPGKATKLKIFFRSVSVIRAPIHSSLSVPIVSPLPVFYNLISCLTS